MDEEIEVEGPVRLSSGEVARRIKSILYLLGDSELRVEYQDSLGRSSTTVKDVIGEDGKIILLLND